MQCPRGRFCDNANCTLNHPPSRDIILTLKKIGIMPKDPFKNIFKKFDPHGASLELSKCEVPGLTDYTPLSEDDVSEEEDGEEDEEEEDEEESHVSRNDDEEDEDEEEEEEENEEEEGDEQKGEHDEDCPPAKK